MAADQRQRLRRRQRRPQRSSVAYHEAGHVVIAYLLGRRIKAATIVPRGVVLGEVQFAGRSEVARLGIDSIGFRARFRIEHSLLLTYAGLEAECRFTGRYRSGGSQQDWAYLLEVQDALTLGDEREACALGYWLQCRATRLVELAWPWIEQIAQLLLDRRALRGTEIHALLDGNVLARRVRDAMRKGQRVLFWPTSTLVEQKRAPRPTRRPHTRKSDPRGLKGAAPYCT